MMPATFLPKSFGPLHVGLSQVNWRKYTDEKGVKRQGPVAKLLLVRAEDQKARIFIDAYAGQHLQWDIFSLYVEKISFFPEFAHLRVYASTPPIGQKTTGGLHAKQYPPYISTSTHSTH